MKTKITVLMILSFLFFNCSSSDDNSPNEEAKVKIEFKNKEKQILVNENLNLLNELILENVDPKAILWNGYDNKVIELTGTTLKGITKGETTITASLKNTDKKTTLKIIVNDVKIAFNKDQIELEKKKTINLSALLTLENVSKDELNWTSENTDIATVVNGVVSAIKEGEVNIIAISKNKQVKGSIKIIVTPIQIEELIIVPGNLDMKIFEKTTLKVQTKPLDADLKDIVWKSSDERIIKINNKAEIEAVGVGEVTVTATSTNGKIGYAKINVKADGIYSIESLDKEIELVDGDIFTLQVNIAPSNANRNDLEFISDNPDAVTVDQNGRISTRANKYGKAIITIRSKKNNNVKDIVKLTVVPFYKQIEENVKINNISYQNEMLSGDLEFTVKNKGQKEVQIYAFSIIEKNGMTQYQDNTKRMLKAGETITYKYKLNNLYKPYVRYQSLYREQPFGHLNTLIFN
ncbi:hypothetical protein HMPREF9713_00535 [Myroides odoratimimus CCUG 12700]|uniref:Ig-like domain-containing protein n=1 Tax=Myroides odoratimimus TaxID=76832 RepID=UPI000353BC7A|nr:Ig-like domain-containing protein [Myroides odoratimimus]EPH13588.1 hypothetical protein HMPREF9713_00535 [Myroides odoratimimus CCUG 12700]